MLEQITTTTQYIFRPSEEEKIELFTNDDVGRFATDESCRYELIGGELKISRMPDFYHQLISMKIMQSFFESFNKHPSGLILTTPGLIFSEFDGVIPDLIFVSHEKCDEILNETDGKFHGAPELVIEILSPGRVNARRDLQIKRELYQIYGVPEYWAIKPLEKEIEVFPFGTEPKIYTENETLKTSFLPEFELNIKQLFAS